MNKGYFYCLYDTLYEEYQKPFVMPSDRVALHEFDIYKQSLKVDCKDEKEKQDIDKRYRLMKYEDIEWNGDGFFPAKDNSFRCYEITNLEDDE